MGISAHPMCIYAYVGLYAHADPYVPLYVEVFSSGATRSHLLPYYGNEIEKRNN